MSNMHAEATQWLADDEAIHSKAQEIITYFIEKDRANGVVAPVEDPEALISYRALLTEISEQYQTERQMYEIIAGGTGEQDV